MYIPSYQIHNVLKVYSRQLSRAGDQGCYGLAGENGNGIEPPGFVGAGKRAAILQRIASDIVKKMTRVGSGKEPQPIPGMSTSHNDLPETADEAHAESGQHVFTYNIIEKDLRKKGEEISGTNSRQLMDCLNRLAEKRSRSASGRNIEDVMGATEAIPHEDRKPD